MPFNAATMAATLQSMIRSILPLAYFPMSALDEVRRICRKMVQGSWMLRMIWVKMRPL